MRSPKGPAAIPAGLVQPEATPSVPPRAVRLSYETVGTETVGTSRFATASGSVTLPKAGITIRQAACSRNIVPHRLPHACTSSARAHGHSGTMATSSTSPRRPEKAALPTPPQRCHSATTQVPRYNENGKMMSSREGQRPFVRRAPPLSKTLDLGALVGMDCLQYGNNEEGRSGRTRRSMTAHLRMPAPTGSPGTIGSENRRRIGRERQQRERLDAWSRSRDWCSYVGQPQLGLLPGGGSAAAGDLGDEALEEESSGGEGEEVKVFSLHDERKSGVRFGGVTVVLLGQVEKAAAQSRAVRARRDDAAGTQSEAGASVAGQSHRSSTTAVTGTSKITASSCSSGGQTYRMRLRQMIMHGQQRKLEEASVKSLQCAVRRMQSRTLMGVLRAALIEETKTAYASRAANDLSTHDIDWMAISAGYEGEVCKAAAYFEVRQLEYTGDSRQTLALLHRRPSERRDALAFRRALQEVSRNRLASIMGNR